MMVMFIIICNNFSKENLKFSQSHIKIILGLYGLLKPFDQIKPYRLEMILKIPNIAPKELAYFWQEFIIKNITSELKQHQNKYLIN